MSRLRAAAVRVPCSTSNLGAGFDCLGLALQRHLVARFIPAGDVSLDQDPGPAALRAPSGALEIDFGGTLAGLSRARRGDDLLTRAFTGRLGAHRVRHVAGLLSAESDIPVARGLGSSAAATVAGILLADAALGRVPEPLEALALATAREGHPDNAAPALLGGLVAVARAPDGAPVAFRLPLSERITFVYAAPALDISTPAARAALPEKVPHAVAARGLGRMAALLRGLATADPELLRLGLLDELHVPHRLPLIPRAPETFAAAESAGAWGATISGSGSGLIALCPGERAAAVLAAMEDALRGSGLATTAFIAAADLEGARALEPEPVG